MALDADSGFRRSLGTGKSLSFVRDQHSMAATDHLDFITTLGREFAGLFSAAGITDVSGQDCYSVIADYLRGEVRADTLVQLTPSQFEELSSAFNGYFECSLVSRELVEVATQNTLKHWAP